MDALTKLAQFPATSARSTMVAISDCHSLRDGRLSFACSFRDGAPAGPCWKKVHGGGCLYGRLDGRGRFTGDDIAFLYPDFVTCIRGRFHDSVLVVGRECSVVATSAPSPSEILSLEFSEPLPRSPLFRH